MKIVDRDAFLAMPAGTVYAKCVEWVFEETQIKGDTIYSEGRAIDWFYQDISASAIEARDSGRWAALLDESKVAGRELEMNYDVQSRDGCFDDDQLFAVLSKKDVEQLIERLRRAL